MSEKLSGDEVSSRVLAILQSSDFTKTLESFSGEKLKPTMNIMAKKINKAKKKLKKLQKRQRKQDKQGVVTVDDVINAPVITERFDISEMPLTNNEITSGVLEFMKDKAVTPPTVREPVIYK
jgi:hypothetical protein